MKPNFKCEELQENKIMPERLSKTFWAFLYFYAQSAICQDFFKNLFRAF